MLAKIKKFTVVLFVALFALTPVLQAQAFLGVGDVVIIVANPYQDIIDGIKAGVGQAFTQFASAFLSNLVTKIEANYKIANFLYYSDALVSGQYLQNYMDKYVPNVTDQRMILTFIPQFSCGKNIDISQELRSQAQNYLGYDPSSLNTSDPNFYLKLSRMGDFLSSPVGWNVYYQDLAASAEAQAEGAAQNEINSPGLKAPHDDGGAVATSINSIVQEEAGSIVSSLNLGTSNPESIVGKLASQLSFAFLNNFIFKGAVFKEQATCLDPTQVSPVAPSPLPNLAAGTPQVSLLQASPSRIAPGATVTLTWDVRTVQGADHAILSPSIGTVGLNGSIQVAVSADTDFSLAVFDKNNNALQVFNASVFLNAGPRGVNPTAPLPPPILPGGGLVP